MDKKSSSHARMSVHILKGDTMKWVLEAKIYSHQNGDEFFHYSDDLTVQAQTLVWYIGVISSHAPAMARLLCWKAMR